MELIRFIGKTTTNSTSGYTGRGTEYPQIVLTKISNSSSEATVKTKTIDDNIDITIDWTPLYGELNERSICCSFRWRNAKCY